MSKPKKISITAFLKRFPDDKSCQEYLVKQRWPKGFICPKCGCTHYYKLENDRFQCTECRHQTSVTAGTFMHRSHVSLHKWFIAMYFVTQDKRGISALQLSFIIGVTYKTAWYMLKRIRTAMGQRDAQHLLEGVVEFDDTYFGGPTVGKKRGRGTEKAKVFIGLSLDKNGNPKFVKMAVTDDLKKESVQKFASASIKTGSTIISDGYRSYIPALAESYNHEHKTYDPNASELKWLHTIISNAKAFIMGTYHGLPGKNLSEYLNEYCYRFSRRDFGAKLFDRLAIALMCEPSTPLAN